MAGNWHPTTPCWDPLDPDQETERCRATKARARKLCDPIGRQSTWRAASIRCALCGVCGVLGHIQMGYLDATITSALLRDVVWSLRLQDMRAYTIAKPVALTHFADLAQKRVRIGSAIIGLMRRGGWPKQAETIVNKFEIILNEY